MRIAGYGAAAQQKCLAHLLRHFKQVEKLKTPQQKELAQVFLDLITEAFRQHRQYRETGARSIYNWTAILILKRFCVASAI
ncbi:MAG: transposase [Microcystis sp.]|jgi:transposase|nr:transposase [Microcystis sp. M046S2]MCA2705556.1 transposase [Microcystis sp. M038S2]MCA2949236.1 transposase [Microcystis sp. M109S1]MCA2953256.1 transposase [Microcystis sp. M112S1]NCR28014.1 transposase [Microcystis aeruginosa LE13-04]NCS40948.1 transposase [Microcystis aeruginosa BS13-10]NCS46060.1 transposase [Microcystis aeruginosa BS11-05]NCT44654.1 transposase [Microcystis aeruginosa G11-09]